MAEERAPWQLECEKMEQRCGYLLKSEQWTDCTFVVGLETNQAVIQAHKLVLAMTSPVFEAMFFGGLSECNSPTIPIPDIQPEVFRVLLQHIYTGDINIESFDMACALWYAARKYMLLHLEKECNVYICSNVGPANACRAYELAYYFEEQTLMDICIQIICTNTNEVLNDSSFEDVELNTLVTVLSLNHLTVNSEVELFRAVARYAEMEQKMQGQSVPVECEPPSENVSGSQPSTSKEMVSQSIENSSQTSTAAGLDSKTPSEVVTRDATTDKENRKEDKSTIRAALEKIRFLSLTPNQFLKCLEQSPDLLTEGESFAVMMNIVSRDSAVPMPTGFSECMERRQPRSDSVDDGPFAKPLFKPSTQSLCVAKKLPTAVDILHGLQSSESKTLESAARAARMVTCSGNISELVEADCVLPLVAALLHPKPSIQYDAAWAITNIASDGHPTHAMTLVMADALPALIGLLGRGGAVAEQAAWALGNIAGEGGTTSSAIIDSGGCEALLELMQPSTPPSSLATFLRTYRVLCQKSSTYFWSRTGFKMVSPIVPYIEILLGLTDEQVLVEACWVLYHLAQGAHFGPEIFTNTVAARLTALLQLASPRVQAAALGAVGSILGTTELFDRYLGSECWDLILNFLNAGNPLLVQYAARAAGNILRTPYHIQQGLNKGILDALAPALTGNDACKCNAVNAITNLCISGNAWQLHLLAEAAVLQLYCRLLGASWRRIGSCVLVGITNLLKKVVHNRNAFIQRLREFGVPLALRRLNREGGEQSDLAQNLLRIHFQQEIFFPMSSKKGF